MAGYTTRISTANTYDNAVGQLMSRQSTLSQLQAQLSASKRVLRPSDDPTAAAQAERAVTRQSRVVSEQRALEVQRNAITEAESTLGSAVSAVQDFRTLVVQAGNGALSATDRASIAQQLVTLRDQILGYANTKDSNGLPLFAGLGSTATPFVDSGGVSFDGIPGQAGSSDVGVPGSLDGFATWMDVPTGNGVFTIAQTGTAANVSTDAGQVRSPAALTGHSYRIQFNTGGGATTYDVLDLSTGTAVQSAQPYTPGQSIAFDGISFTASGTPAAGDALTIAPSTRTSLFNVLDQAIAAVRDGSGAALTQGTTQALAQIDAGMARLSASRGRAGDLLNQVDNIATRQESRSVQLEADRSRAEDLDVVKALSDFQTQQTAYSAALGSYAQIQKLSLFNFIT
ncbi:flagellar hook-associated protein FlgL [Xenophilus aerolatus]|nr:flagellar hook-associated protein FlgL [Xenophilus aerolatus]